MIRFSKHALEAMAVRAIALEWVAAQSKRPMALILWSSRLISTEEQGNGADEP